MAVDESFAATIGINNTTNNTFVITRHFVILQPFSRLQTVSEVESNADFGLFPVCPHTVAIGSVARYQFDGVKQDRFSSTGFSGQRGQSPVKFEIQ